ncbi:MAG: pyridoxamine 5'-phosphate oxidase family protein [bacterium]
MIKHIPMRLKNREVTDPELIEAMLKMIQVCHLGMLDEDGYPYVIPLNYGMERTADAFIFYLHFALEGHKIDCFKYSPHVCLSFSAYDDFPDDPYQNHKHDYRSIVAKGDIELLRAEDQFDDYMHAHEILMTYNGRVWDYEARAKKIPPMYMARIVCPLAQVRAKSEFPLKTIEDVPFHKR